MFLRGALGMRKTYLRGLTQQEEKQEGVDFFVQMSPETRLYAFQFKAPKRGSLEEEPYKFTLDRQHHEKLSALAGISSRSVFYVLPFYVMPTKLQNDIPILFSDTWFLSVESMRGKNPFMRRSTLQKTGTLKCIRGLACTNPHYELRRAPHENVGDVVEIGDRIPVEDFAEWYAHLHDEDTEGEKSHSGRKNVRGLQVAIVPPSGR